MQPERPPQSYVLLASPQVKEKHGTALFNGTGHATPPHAWGSLHRRIYCKIVSYLNILTNNLSVMQDSLIPLPNLLVAEWSDGIGAEIAAAVPSDHPARTLGCEN